jgi:pimeloyl-ACP methyl ester carboxylesterase
MEVRFPDERIAELRETGLAYFDDGFYLSLSFLFELEMYTPYETFPDLYVPTLVIHGDEDTAVPYEVTRQQSLEAPEVRFETIEGADHAFVEKKNERRSFKYTIEHLNNI